MYAQVAVENVNCTFDKDYDYSIPQQLEGKALVGCRVAVPFGIGNRKRIGIITRLTDSTQGKRIKSISAVLDEAPLLSNEMMSLARWISEQTFCTYYEAVKAMLPAGINHKIIRSFCAVPGVDESIVASLDSDEKQVYDYLLSRSGYVKPETKPLIVCMILSVLTTAFSLVPPMRCATSGIITSAWCACARARTMYR